MKTHAIKTHLIQLDESLPALLDRYLPPLEENSIVVVTSKIVSLSEGRTIQKKIGKETLIKQEADAYLDEPNPHGVLLTIKNGILIPNAGIDESNANGVYILYPKDSHLSARKIWEHLRTQHRLRHLGVLITDSHTSPMRWGVTGIALAWCGFAPLNNYIGTPDCFGRHLHFTKANVVDALAASAVFAMGEGNEQTPLALITELEKVTFVESAPTQEEIESLKIPMQEDLYGPLLMKGDWKS